jgi:uncharacterized tellurite resistance protein B-like protein
LYPIPALDLPATATYGLGMSILKWLGFGGASNESPPAAEAGDTATVRRIVGKLESLPPDRARHVAAFAYILGRVANADLEISAEETREMERLVREHGGLDEEQAILVVQIAKSQNQLFGATEDYLVTREFKQLTTVEERKRLLDCLFAVSAADDSISSAEETLAREIASELGLEHQDYVAIRARYSDKREVLKGLKDRG